MITLVSEVFGIEFEVDRKMMLFKNLNKTGATFHIFSLRTMSSRHRITFPNTIPPWGNSTGHWWISLTKVQKCGALIISLMLQCCLNTLWINSPVASDLKRHDSHVTSAIFQENWKITRIINLYKNLTTFHCTFSFDSINSSYVNCSHMGPLLLTWFNFNPNMNK